MFNNYTQQTGGYNQFIPSTNKQFVRSLEEAIGLPAGFNSQNIYFDVNQNLMYDICTNGQGQKSWAVYKIVPYNPNQSEQKSEPDRLAVLERKVEDIINGKYNVKSTDGTDASAK